MDTDTHHILLTDGDADFVRELPIVVSFPELGFTTVHAGVVGGTTTTGRGTEVGTPAAVAADIVGANTSQSESGGGEQHEQDGDGPRGGSGVR